MVNFSSRVFLLLALFAGVSAFVLSALSSLSFPYALNYSEDSIPVMAAELLAGRGLYSVEHHSGIPLYLAPYTPVYYLVVAVGKLIYGGWSLIPGRLVSVAASCMTAGLIGVGVHRAGGTRLTAIVGGMLFLCFYPVQYWGVLHRVDALALVFSMGGLVVLMRARASSMNLLLAGILFLFAIMTKHSYVAALAACVSMVFMVSPKKALGLLSGVIAASVCIYVLLHIWSDGGVVFALFTSLSNPYDFVRFRNLVGQFVPSPIVVMWGLMIIAVAARGGFGSLKEIIGRGDDTARAVNPGSLALLFLCLASAQALVTVGKEGSAINYFLEVSAGMALCAGIALSWIIAPKVSTSNGNLASARNGNNALSLLHIILGASILFSIYMRSDSIRRSYSLWSTRETLETTYNADDWVRRLTEPDDLVLSSVPALALFTGRKAVTNDPYTFTLLNRQGLWDDKPLVEALNEKKVALVFVEGLLGVDKPYKHFSQKVHSAVVSNYMYYGTINGYGFYLPRINQ